MHPGCTLPEADTAGDFLQLLCFAANGSQKGKGIPIQPVEMTFCLCIIRFRYGKCHVFFLDVGVGAGKPVGYDVVIVLNAAFLPGSSLFRGLELQMNRRACQRFAEHMDLQLALIIQRHEKFTIFLQDAHLDGFRDIRVIGVLHGKRQAVPAAAQVTDPIVIHGFIRDAFLYGAPLIPRGKNAAGLFWFPVRRCPAGRRLGLNPVLFQFQAASPPFRCGHTGFPCDRAAPVGNGISSAACNR